MTPAWIKLWKELILLLGVLLLVAICFFVLVSGFNTETKPQLQSEKVAVDWDTFGKSLEVELGKQITERYLESQLILEDSFIVNEIKVITAHLLSKMDHVSYNYNVYIVENTEVNAYTLPGGNIVLNTSLLQFVDSAEELAAVMAHEIGHAEKRHVVERVLAIAGLSVIMAVITGGDPGVLHELAQILLTNIFSQTQELQADYYALQLLEKANIEPSTFANFFKRTEEINGSTSSSIGWFMSHPTNKDRIQQCETYKVSSDFKPVTLPVIWKDFQAHLNFIS